MILLHGHVHTCESLRPVSFTYRYPGVNCSQDLKEGRVCGKGAGQPKLLPHQDTEEPLRQRLGVRCWSRHAGAQQDLPACWRREVWHSAAAPSLLPVRSQVLVDGRQEGSLKGQRSNVSKQQPILKKCAVWGRHVDIQKYWNYSSQTLLYSHLTAAALMLWSDMKTEARFLWAETGICFSVSV